MLELQRGLGSWPLKVGSALLMKSEKSAEVLKAFKFKTQVEV